MILINKNINKFFNQAKKLSTVFSINKLNNLDSLRNETKQTCLTQITNLHSESKFNLFPNKTYLNGNWVDSISLKSFEVHDPATLKLLGTVPDCDVTDVDIAVDSAKNAFNIWSNYTAEQRSKILKKLVDCHIEHKQTLAELITYENGKPLRDSLAEIETSIKAYDWFSEEAKRTYGDIIPSPALNKRLIVLKQPIGVCGFLTPWNFPSSMLARKAAAALAAGCTIVIKPSEDTPYSALALCQLAEMAGLPSGCINVVTTSKKNTPIVGKAICEHPAVKKVSFTGSTAVGKIILANCANGVKKVQLELGGNAPFIVFNSADLSKAIAGVMACKFRCSGQTCICANRILVQEEIYDKFVEALALAMKEQLNVGIGFDPKTTQGPLISENAVQKLDRLVDDCKVKGGKILLGGKRLESKSLSGYFYEPTLVSDINLNMQIATEEIFGPIASIIKFKTEDEALRIANSVDVGLAGYFYSNDLSQIWRVAEKLEVGMVGANESIISMIEAPFSGIKQSGFGYEGSKYGINEYLLNKYVCMGV